MQLKQYIQSIFKSDFFLNTAILASGSIFAQVLAILFAPISSRLFSPGNFGTLGLYVGITGILGTFAFSHYPQAILIAKEEDEARNLIWFSFFLASIISLITSIFISAILFFTDLLTPLGYWALAIPVNIMLNAIITVLSVWANRIKQYKIVSKNRIATALFTISIQLGVGYFIDKKHGLIAGLFAGQILGATLLIGPFLFREKIKIGIPRPMAFKEYAWNYRRFIIYTTPSDFINNLLNQLPIYFLNSMAGINYVGNFTYAQRLLGLPSSLIGNSIADVFRQKASDIYRNRGECFELFKKTAVGLFLIGILPLIFIVLFAPKFFVFVLGEQWLMAGEMAQVLSPLLFLRIIVSPLSYLYTLAGKMREDLIIQLGSICVLTLSFIVTNQFFSNKDLLLIAYSIAYFGIYLIYLIRSFQFSKGK